jgi:predicted metalloprotease with PDZ domain
MNNADLPAIQYTVWPADLHGHRFRVKLHITNPDANGQILQMPAWIPGSYLIRDFSKQIETIDAFLATNKKRLALERVDNDHWRIPPTNGPVEVLTTVYAFDSSVRAAYLDAERAFFFNASSSCLAVKDQEHLSCSLAIAAPELAFADHWTVQTTLRAAKTDERGFGFT